MDKFKIIWLMILFLIANLCFASCDYKTYKQIQMSLKQQIPSITWLDINDNPDSRCQFNIRYYPCNCENFQKLVTYLPTSLTHANCKLTHLGHNEKTDGDCNLKDNEMICES